VDGSTENFPDLQIEVEAMQTVNRRTTRNLKVQPGIRKMFSVFLGLIVLTGCGNAQPRTAPPATVAPIPETATLLANATQLNGPYLGQKPPGMEPEIFARGIVSDPNFMEYSGTFSPDGSEYYFNRWFDSMESVLLYSRFVDGIWTEPEQLAITEGYVTSEAFVTLDNKWLYFIWGRPVPEGRVSYLNGGGYYVSERMPEGWSEPKYAGQGMFISASRDGQIYTTDMSARNRNGSTYLATVAVEEGVFTQLERLPLQSPMGDPAHPCIAPDGSFLIFDVGHGNYLLVSFKQADGTWGDPIDLTKHGFDTEAGGAYVSPDGRYLFFALDEDIWWVDIQVIENLRPEE
jgi:hypothetical protein